MSRRLAVTLLPLFLACQQPRRIAASTIQTGRLQIGCLTLLDILHGKTAIQGRLLEDASRAMSRPVPVVVEPAPMVPDEPCNDDVFRIASEPTLRPREDGFRLEFIPVDGGLVFEATKEELNYPQPDGGDVTISMEMFGFFYGTLTPGDGGWIVCMSCEVGQAVSPPHPKPPIR